MHSPTNPSPRYFQNLDGLRFFAFLVVFISHATLFLGYKNNSNTFSIIERYVLVNGDIGVAFFFVLSGFLITYLLLKEKRAHGKIALQNFHLRRIKRIWPVYFLTLAIGFFVLPLFTLSVLPFDATPTLSTIPWYAFFLANFNLAFHQGSSLPVDILWSISVEQQFYLFWAVAINYIPQKYIPKIIALLLGVAGVYRYLHAGNDAVLAYATFSVLSDLLIGALLGWILVERPRLLAPIRQLPRMVIFSFYTMAAALVIFRHTLLREGLLHPIAFRSLSALIPLALSILFALIIAEQNESVHSLWKVGKSTTYTFLGKISYGLYSYHIIAFVAVLLIAHAMGFTGTYTSGSQWVVYMLATFGGTVALAYLSHTYIEKPCLGK